MYFAWFSEPVQEQVKRSSHTPPRPYMLTIASPSRPQQRQERGRVVWHGDWRRRLDGLPQPRPATWAAELFQVLGGLRRWLRGSKRWVLAGWVFSSGCFSSLCDIFFIEIFDIFCFNMNSSGTSRSQHWHRILIYNKDNNNTLFQLIAVQRVK